MPSTVPTTAYSGRSNGKICASTIGGITEARKAAPNPITMNATTGCRATARSAGDVMTLLKGVIVVGFYRSKPDCFRLETSINSLSDPRYDETDLKRLPPRGR